jgi:hypothetical protein
MVDDVVTIYDFALNVDFWPCAELARGPAKEANAAMVDAR